LKNKGLIELSELYSMIVHMKAKPVVVVGGGKVATRKVETLLNAEANVTIVSPEITDELKEWVDLQKVSWKQKRFEADDVQEAFIIIATTDHTEINLNVHQAAHPHQLINIVDRPELSNFIVPSTLQRGKLLISVSTSGASPGLSQKIKQELATMYDETYEEYLDFLNSCRQKVLEEVGQPEIRKYIFRALLDSRFLEMTRLNQFHEREEHFLDLFKQTRDTGDDE
jgi:precorrin-2 dehydrogenase/sirohydrochlorin ferrochelatase